MIFLAQTLSKKNLLVVVIRIQKKLMLRKTIQIVLAFSDFFKLVNEQQKQKFDLISPEANLGFSRRGRIFKILVDFFLGQSN